MKVCVEQRDPPIIWDNSGTSRDDQHPFGTVLAVVIDVDGVPHAVLHRIPHLPRRRHRFHAGGTKSERRSWYKVLMFFMAVLTCDTTRYDGGEVLKGEGGLIHSFPYTCTL